MGEEAAMVAVLCLFGWIPLKVIFNHRLRMAEIQARKTGDSKSLREDLEALRAEVKALRDTATKFDISFDATLDSLQKRVDTLETRRPVSPAETTGQSQHLGGGR